MQSWSLVRNLRRMTPSPFNIRSISNLTVLLCGNTPLREPLPGYSRRMEEFDASPSTRGLALSCTDFWTWWPGNNECLPFMLCLASFVPILGPVMRNIILTIDLNPIVVS